MSLVVWKLGGSLFDLPDLPQRIQRLKRERYADVPVVIIPGGGPFADVVRKLDPTHRLKPLQSHHLALDAMRLSANFVASTLGHDMAIAEPEQQNAQIEAWHQSESESAAIEVWDVISSWHALQPGLASLVGTLPTDWTLTSDSIAAALAAFWKAERLVLCKSIDRPSPRIQDWAETEAVDAFFPQIAPKVQHIDWVNLRAE